MMKPGVTTPNVFKKQGLVVIALSLVGLLGAVLIAGLFKYNDTIEIPLIKARFQLRGELDADPRIRIVQIDDNSISALQELGVSYPFPRELQGKILRSLTDSGARYVCFDLLFDMNSMHGQEDDEAFRDAILYARSKGTEVILASALPESKSGVYSQLTFLEPNRALMAADPILGLANTSTISVEKGKGSYRDRERAIIEYQDAVYYSQATQMFRLLLESEGRAFIPAEHGIDENGFMYVNYFGGRSKRIKSVQYVKLFPEVLSGINPLTGESAENADDEWEEGETAKRLEMNTEGTFVDSGDFEGTFVFVGSFSEADNDYFSTPFTDKMFGVETNASAFQTFLSGKHIRLIPIWATIVSLIIFSLIAGHLAYYMPSKFAPFAGIIALAIITAFIFMGFVWWQLLMNCTYTVFTIALSFGSTLAYKVVTEEREKAKIRRTFGRYVSEAVVNEIISNLESILADYYCLLIFLGGCFKPARQIDCVADDAVVRAPDTSDVAHNHVPVVDSDTDFELRHTDLAHPRMHFFPQVFYHRKSAHHAVESWIFGRYGCSENRHNSVAHKLVHISAVRVDDMACRFKELVQECQHILRLHILADRREVPYIAEENSNNSVFSAQ